MKEYLKFIKFAQRLLFIIFLTFEGAFIYKTGHNEKFSLVLYILQLLHPNVRKYTLIE